MNRRIAAVLVALSVVAGVGAGFLVERLHSAGAEAHTPRSSPTLVASPAPSSPEPSTPATTSATEDVSALTTANRADRAAAGLPSWSPADPEGADGRPLEVGKIVPGGIDPVMAGNPVFKYMRQGYLVADENPSCDGNHWLWAGQLSGGLYVAATPTRHGHRPGHRQGRSRRPPTGSASATACARSKATYGAALSGVEPDDNGDGWVHVQDGDRWLAFALGRAGQVTDRSRVGLHRGGHGSGAAPLR